MLKNNKLIQEEKSLRRQPAPHRHNDRGNYKNPANWLTQDDHGEERPDEGCPGNALSKKSETRYFINHYHVVAFGTETVCNPSAGGRNG